MGLGWAANNLVLKNQDVTIEVVQYEDKSTQIEQVVSTSPVNVSEYRPTFSTATTVLDSAPEILPAPPQYLPAPGNWHRGQYTPAATVSDTEEDSDAESFANKYIGRGHTFIESPVTVFGPGAIVNRSIGGRIHARHENPLLRSRKNRVTKRSPKPANDQPKSSFAEQFVALMEKPASLKEAAVKSEEKPVTDIKYPTLPTLSGRDTEPPVPYKFRELGRRPPDPHRCPGLPPVQPSTPAGYDPSYRYRRPNDTRSHHDSAGVNPLGALARVARIRKEQAAPSTARNVTSGSAVRRHHRIVSGSFGSFEVNKPSRFDERKYRLLQRGKRKDKMEED
jgi:hypothetical protein